MLNLQVIIIIFINFFILNSIPSTSDGHIIKNGETVNILLTNLHENPNIWPNPKKFNPDHFLPEKIAARHPYSYIPFGFGPRICIGIIKIVLSKTIIFNKIFIHF